MKLKCVTTQGRGLVFKDNSVGLTVGKIYSAFAIQSSMTEIIDASNVRFFLLNDAGVWEAYRPYFFVPAE